MTKKTTAQSSPEARRSGEGLDSRYGEIGISALAAALRYQGATRRATDDAPLAPQMDRSVKDFAA